MATKSTMAILVAMVVATMAAFTTAAAESARVAEQSVTIPSRLAPAARQRVMSTSNWLLNSLYYSSDCTPSSPASFVDGTVTNLCLISPDQPGQSFFYTCDASSYTAVTYSGDDCNPSQVISSVTGNYQCTPYSQPESLLASSQMSCQLSSTAVLPATYIINQDSFSSNCADSFEFNSILNRACAAYPDPSSTYSVFYDYPYAYTYSNAACAGNYTSASFIGQNATCGLQGTYGYNQVYFVRSLGDEVAASSGRPTPTPTHTPTLAPTHSLSPTQGPTQTPTLPPSLAPSASPSTSPSAVPSVVPSAVPTAQPSVEPSQAPSVEPSMGPTRMPSLAPTVSPTHAPTVSPSLLPTPFPVTAKPSPEPTVTTLPPTNVKPSAPSRRPTLRPSAKPTRRPSSVRPSRSPTRKPSRKPSRSPTRKPTRKPSLRPSRKPSRKPTRRPTCRYTSYISMSVTGTQSLSNVASTPKLRPSMAVVFASSRYLRAPRLSTLLRKEKVAQLASTAAERVDGVSVKRSGARVASKVAMNRDVDDYYHDYYMGDYIYGYAGGDDYYNNEGNEENDDDDASEGNEEDDDSVHNEEDDADDGEDDNEHSESDDGEEDDSAGDDNTVGDDEEEDPDDDDFDNASLDADALTVRNTIAQLCDVEEYQVIVNSFSSAEMVTTTHDHAASLSSTVVYTISLSNVQAMGYATGQEAYDAVTSKLSAALSDGRFTQTLRANAEQYDNNSVLMEASSSAVSFSQPTIDERPLDVNSATTSPALSTEAKVGIALTGAFLLAMLVVAGVFYYRRKMLATPSTASAGAIESPSAPVSEMSEVVNPMASPAQVA